MAVQPCMGWMPIKKKKSWKKSCPDCLRIQLTVAWLNLTMPNQKVKNGLQAKNIKLNQTNFFLEKQLIKVSYTYWPFHSANSLKNSFLDFVHLSWTKFFLVETIIISFIYLLTLFIVQNLKKFLQRIQSYQDAQFLGPKWLIYLNENFFSENLLMRLVSFVHAYLHAKNQSQILIY